MTTPVQLTPAELADHKAAIARQQQHDLDAAVAIDTALHQLADHLHNAAFADPAVDPKPSFAASLQAAALDLLAQAAKHPDFPSAGLARLHLYAPPAPAIAPPADSDPIAAAETAAESAGAVAAA